MKLYGLYLVSLVCLFLFSCSSDDKPLQEEGFTIDVKIDSMPDGQATLMKLDLVTNESIIVDSVQVKDGQFQLVGKVDGPYFHTLMLNDRAHRIHFFLENSPITMSGSYHDIRNVKVSGSLEDSLFRSYNWDDVFKRVKGKEIMLSNPDYAFAAFTAYYQFQMYNIHPDTMDMVMNGFSDEVKKSVYYDHLTRLHNTLKKVAIGAKAPSFSIPDTKGKVVNLDDFKGQYVLLDFWASWCAPCRAANPKIVEAYNQLKGKNFTMVGISVDKDKDSWLKAVEDDGLTWPNLSNANGWDDISTQYAVKSVPQNFLLDPNGVILAKNIEPEKLTEEIPKHMGSSH